MRHYLVSKQQEMARSAPCSVRRRVVQRNLQERIVDLLDVGASRFMAKFMTRVDSSGGRRDQETQ